MKNVGMLVISSVWVTDHMMLCTWESVRVCAHVLFSVSYNCKCSVYICKWSRQLWYTYPRIPLSLLRVPVSGICQFQLDVINCDDWRHRTYILYGCHLNLLCAKCVDVIPFFQLCRRQSIVGKAPFDTIGSVVGVSLFVLITSQLLGNVAVVQLAKPNVEVLSDGAKGDTTGCDVMPYTISHHE